MCEFEDSILAVWAAYFRCDLADFDRPGTQLVEWAEQRDSDWVYIWQIGERTFVRLGPQLTDLVQHVVARLPPHTALRAADLISHLEDDASLEYTVDLCYLQPDDFKLATSPDGFSRRQLSAADADAWAEMQAACTDDDLEEADVGLDHEAAFGCFQGRHLVALASMYTLRDGFADIGILTHPEFRGKGLGKAAVSAVCEWLLLNGRMPLYRYEVRNLGSAAIATGLGFKKYYVQESVKVSRVTE